MDKLAMIKAFAELEGVMCGEMHGKLWTKDEHGCFNWNGYGHKEYNPLTDYALTFKAQFDYSVGVGHEQPYVYTSELDGVIPFDKSSLESFAHAIIECILRSKGLWGGAE